MATPKRKNIIGPAVREMRVLRGWTQEYLSAKVRALGWNLTRTGLAKIENTESRVTDCDLLFLAKALGCSVGNFFPGDPSVEYLEGKICSCRFVGKSIDPQHQLPPLARIHNGISRRLTVWNSHRL